MSSRLAAWHSVIFTVSNMLERIILPFSYITFLGSHPFPSPTLPSFDKLRRPWILSQKNCRLSPPTATGGGHRPPEAHAWFRMQPSPPLIWLLAFLTHAVFCLWALFMLRPKALASIVFSGHHKVLSLHADILCASSRAYVTRARLTRLPWGRWKAGSTSSSG